LRRLKAAPPRSDFGKYRNFIDGARVLEKSAVLVDAFQSQQRFAQSIRDFVMPIAHCKTTL